MCLNFNAAASQANMIDSSEKVNNKKAINTQNSQENNEDISTNASTLKNGDNVEVENQYKESGMAATSISFDEKEKEVNSDPLQAKIRVNDEDMTIGEFISSMNDKTMQAILDSFDKMLQASRKMMEENKRFIKEVKIPQEQIRQKELNQELMQEDFVQKQIFENQL